jgi:hypothetical protein
MLYIVHKIRKIKHLDQNELFTVPFSSDPDVAQRQAFFLAQPADSPQAFVHKPRPCTLLRCYAMALIGG